MTLDTLTLLLRKNALVDFDIDKKPEAKPDVSNGKDDSNHKSIELKFDDKKSIKPGDLPIQSYVIENDYGEKVSLDHLTKNSSGPSNDLGSGIYTYPSKKDSFTPYPSNIPKIDTLSYSSKPIEEISPKLYPSLDSNYGDIGKTFGLKGGNVYDVSNYLTYKNLNLEDYVNIPTITIPHLTSRFTGQEDNDDFQRDLAKLLLTINPSDGNKNVIRKISDDTSSLVVGEANGRIFKIYANSDEGRKIAEKEVAILERLADNHLLASRVTRLSISLHDIGLQNRIKNIFGSETDSIFDRYYSGYLSFRGHPIIITENETPESIYGIAGDEDLSDLCTTPRDKNIKNNEGVGEYIRFMENQSQSHFDKMMDKLVVWANMQDYTPMQSDFRTNPLVNRLYTLAALHVTKPFKIVEEKYHDFDLIDPFTHNITSELLSTYNSASERQKVLFEKRKEEGTLLFTHGDAKYDNWLNFSMRLADFGSAKVSTEYKDIAKSLLDASHHLQEEGLLEYSKMFYRSSQDDNDEHFLKTCDLDGINFLTPFKKMIREDIKLYQNDGISFDEMKQNIQDKYQQVIEKSSGKNATDQFIDMYIHMREKMGRKINESNEDFKRNVYDAIVTESVRTIQYKQSIPSQKLLVDYLVNVANHYAGVINEN